MKRMLLLIMGLLVLLSGCVKQTEQTEQTKPVQEEQNIDFRTGTDWKRAWDPDNDFVVKVDACVVPDEEAAVRIATAIYRESPIHTYAPQSVFYDEKNEVWVVKFYAPIPESGPVATDFPVHAVVLQKEDGKVLGIFKG